MPSLIRQALDAAERALSPESFYLPLKARKEYAQARAAGTPQREALDDICARYEACLAYARQFCRATDEEEKAWTALSHKQHTQALAAHKGPVETYESALSAQAATPRHVRARQGR